jgi:predicted nucleic acid-binding protein
MILVDTSVWIDHLRRGHAGLADLLDQGQVVVHPFVIGEISLGNLKRRAEVLGLLAELPAAMVVPHDEVLEAVARRGLAGTGIGWTDAHLLASALVERLSVWTLDRRLGAAADRLHVAWRA